MMQSKYHEKWANQDVYEIPNPYGFMRKTPYNSLFVSGEWDDNLESFIKENPVEAIYLNIAWGWRGNDYAFLEKIQTLKKVDILTGGHSKGLDSLTRLPALVELSVTTATIDKPLDFSKCTMLKKCFVSWKKQYADIFNHSTLEELYIDGLDAEFNPQLAQLTQLRFLQLANTKITDIDFLRNYLDLKWLTLENCKKIADFSPVGSLQDLWWLTISGSPQMRNIDFLSTLTKLHSLSLSDNKEVLSIKSLHTLQSLRTLWIGNTIVEDGDLGVLKQLPNLSLLAITPRKHYNHKVNCTWNWTKLGENGNFSIVKKMRE